MSRLLRLPVLAAAVFLAVTVASRQPLARGDDPKEPPKDKAGELPAGAKLRLGGGPLMFRYTPSVTLLPPDYKTLVTPDIQRGLRKFDLATGKSLGGEKASAPGTSGQVVVSGDGKRFVVVATGILTVRDVESGKEIQQIKPPQGFSTVFAGVPVVSLSHDGKALAQGGQSTGNKGAVIVWDVDKGESIFQAGLQHNGPPVPVLSPDGKYVATRPYQPSFGPRADDKGPAITVWQTDGGKELFTVRPTSGGFQISTMAFSPDGGLLAAACSDGPVDVWEVPGGKPKHVLFGRSGQGARVAFSPDGKTLAAVATDGTIQRWSTDDGKLVGTTEGPAALPLNSPQGIAFADKDRVVAWGAAGPAPVVWEAPSGKLLTRVPEHTGGIKSIGFAAGGKEVVTSGQEGRVVRWDATTGKPLGPIELRASRSLGLLITRYPVNVSPDGTRAISLNVPNVVFDLATGSEEFALPRGPTNGYSSLSLTSADASWVVIISAPFDQKKTGTCVVWDVANRKKVAEFELTAGTLMPAAAAFSPDGSRMVMAVTVNNPEGGQQILRVTGWDLKTGKKLGQVEDVTIRGPVSVAAASNSYAVVMGMGKLRAFDYESGRGGDEFESTGPGHPNGPVAFSPDGKRFVVGVSAQEPGGVVGYAVRVHDWPSGQVLHTFTGHTGPVTALVFSADGKTLASGSQDSTVILWDMDAAK
jgi:WD40 repeat protein